MQVMLITNDISVVEYANKSQVDRIFIDLELNGKYERQGHLDTHISTHQISDVKKIKPYCTYSELLVRVNPLFENSKSEIDTVISSGADVIMLPMFKTQEDVKEFIGYVDGRAKVSLLLETPEAANNINSIVSIDGIDEIHIGLNDLHLGMNLRSMFELLSNGTVDKLSKVIKREDIRLGFGGVARVGQGNIPAENIIREHARLNSELVILSRSFLPNREESSSYQNINLEEEVNKIKAVYYDALKRDYYESNRDKENTFHLINEKVFVK